MWKRSISVLIAVMVLLGISGCGRVKLTTGLTRAQFARIDGEVVSMEMAKLLLAEYRYSYELLFDEQVWSKDMNGITSEQYVKNEVKKTLESIIYAKHMAEELNITVTAEEQNRIDEAAKEYMSGFSRENGATGDFTLTAVKEYYEWLLIAEKGFYGITDSVDTTVSTDEARRILVQYIFFSTVQYDEYGNETDMSDANKLVKHDRAEAALKRIKENGDFMSLAKEYSDDTNYTLELGQGEFNRDFVKAAFALDSGEVSDIVETDRGYYVIKCINYNVESDYEEQCKKVVLARRRDIYSEQYTAYATGRAVEYNDRFTADISVRNIEKGSGKLYEIYKEYFY